MYNYDALGRLIESHYQNGALISYCYDELGNRTCEIGTSNIGEQLDIMVSSLELNSNTLCQSATFNVTTTIDNLGNLSTVGFNIKILISIDTIFDENIDILLLSRYLTGIAPAGMIEIDESVELPGNLNPGEYFILLVADPENIVGELSETNNMAFEEVQITESGGPTIVTSSVPDTCDMSVGTASVLVLEGEPPYSFVWSTNPVQTESSISDIMSGVYSVTITDATGCQDVHNVTVSNEGTQPAPSFTYSIDGLEVTFTNTTPNGENFVWDFGDGGQSLDTNSSHVFDSNGTYMVCLLASNQCSDVTICIGISLVEICDRPQVLNIVSTTGSSITFTWEEVLTATSYAITYREEEGIWASDVYTTNNQYTISGLSPETLYEIQVTSVCGMYNSTAINTMVSTSVLHLPSFEEFISIYREFEGGCSQLEMIACDIVGNRIVSVSSCGGLNYQDMVLMATDLDGNILWAKKLSFDENIVIANMKSINNDNFYVAFTYGYDTFLIIKVDTDGNISWMKRVNEYISSAGFGRRIGFEVTPSEDIIVAYSKSFEGEKYYNLIKYDSSGVKQWAKRIRESGATFTPSIQDVMVDSQGGIYVTGATGGTGGNQWYFAKHNANGNLMWTRQIRPSSAGDNDFLLEIMQDTSAFYGVSNQYDNNVFKKMYLTKFDNVGMPIWNRSYNNILATGISFYGDSIVVSGLSGGAGTLLWFDKNGNETEDPSKYGLPSTFLDIHNPLSDKLLICGRIDSTNCSRPVILSIDMKGNEYDFLCNDSYIGYGPGTPGWDIIAETFQIFDISGASD
ncbi:MAG: CARDB domain-containing protein, partial [Saprospiraceae bacterium]